MTKITVDKALIEQAIEALEMGLRFRTTGVGRPPEQYNPPAITALRAALAEPAVEPVAWVLSHSQGIEFSSKYPMQRSRNAAEQMARQHMGTMTVTPLYSSPPSEVPLLSDEEIDSTQQAWIARGMNGSRSFARDIEQLVRRKRS